MEDDTQMMPAVFKRDGQVLTNSVALANHFKKRHDNVLRDIKGLEISSDLRRSWFIETTTIDERGRSQPAFDITKDGFSILAFGWTGKQAMAFKIAYIAAFNRMLETLAQMDTRQSAPPPDWNDPAMLRQTLVSYTFMLETSRAETAEEKTKREAAESRASAMEPWANAARVIATTNYSMTGRETAKLIGQKPSSLFRYMGNPANHWAYRQGSAWLAYQDRIDAGHLVHKVTWVQDQDGKEKMRTSMRITAKGAVLLQREMSQLSLFNTQPTSANGPH